jgi:16S rRNA (cytosine967-C5)-methyltransferase
LTARKPPRRFGAKEQRPEETEIVPGLAARILAALAVADVMTGTHQLDERFATDGALFKAQDMEPRDRSLARSIATVALRRMGTIKSILGRFLKDGYPKKVPHLEWILVIGAAQILYLDVPDHAAVDLAVRSVRRDTKLAPFAGLTNAVLRNLIRQRDLGLPEEDAFVDLPNWLSARWRKTYGDDVAKQMIAAQSREPTLDLTLREPSDEWLVKLGGRRLPTGSLRLETHAPIHELPGYEEGQWWVQDAAAALPAQLLQVEAGQRVIDLCAAPGGKTAQLAAKGAQVVALDRSAERLKRVAANLVRLGLQAEMRVGDALSFSAAPFDAVLLDAPCSSTGTIRRHPDVAWSKKSSDIVSLAAIQAKMLDRAVHLLKPGGRLVYSVCSLEPEEGEAQIAALLRRNQDVRRVAIMPGEIGIAAEWLNDQGELRTLPHFLPDPEPRLAGIDGFFAARLTKV